MCRADRSRLAYRRGADRYDVLTMDIERILASRLARYPRLRILVRRARFALWHSRIAARAIMREMQFDPNRILWINPMAIDRIGVGWGDYSKLHGIGKVVRGNWDLNTMLFKDLDLYSGLRSRFVDGVDWKETCLYRTNVALIEMKRSPWGIHTETELAECLQKIDELYEDIRRNGYRTQKQIAGGGRSLSIMNEVTIRIGRNGELLFEDGRHRLAIAKILGLPKIPILVTWRHHDWYLFRLKILDYARSKGGKIYQRITHPDLDDIPAEHGDTRFELISSNLPFKSGTLLDIGASWGYFCHKFEEMGFRCYAVEKYFEAFYFLDRLRIAEGRKFTAVRSDIFEFWEKSEFDVVLALNIFHHFLKTEHTYHQLINFLHRLRTRIMFFEPHLPDESQMQGSYRNFGGEEFVRFIAQHMGLPRWECIGYGEEKRPIYKIYGD
jgi:2-polyprenyl-3-methyl-5-hydroxy-6-metoxy-1,4-benzoquinol methylase